MEIHLKIIGTLLVFLAVTHSFFPKRFNWKTELNSLSLLNRQMMQVHTFFIALVILFIGILCLFSADDLMKTAFGRKIALALSLFWCFRLLIQFFVYSSELWKGKKFETTIHILFSILWLYMTVVFFLVYWN